jgi:hypothetical protein
VVVFVCFHATTSIIGCLDDEVMSIERVFREQQQKTNKNRNLDVW